MIKRVAVALSGGVDSAVTAAILKNEGYDVVGITGKMTCGVDSETVVFNARNVADKLGIEHYVYDATEEFKKRVIDYFQNSYRSGETPNPCIMCNKFIKWGCLFDYCIEKLGANYIATGHYADIKYLDGYYKLYPAQDENKDQLYFLFLLNQEKLSRTLFPLAKYRKSEVRQLAQKYDLPPKSAKESQDICFIKAPITTKKYLNLVFKPEQGYFVEKSTGKILGKHDGFWQYTIGQRKGIGIAAPEALYVVGINSDANVVYVGYKDELYTDSLSLREICWSYPQNRNLFKALVKIRYNMNAVEALILKENNDWKIKFNEPVSAITAGQACVLYDLIDGHLLGGGFITC